VVIAAYRIDHDHWNSDRALEEAKADGMSFFQTPRKNYIRDFHAHIMEAKSAPVITVPAVALPVTPAVQ
jgi:hypothetical protein